LVFITFRIGAGISRQLTSARPDLMGWLATLTSLAVSFMGLEVESDPEALFDRLGSGVVGGIFEFFEVVALDPLSV
jgi:hypothetical protein